MTLKIEDLDEFEGLTADMVRAWLRAKGWELVGTEAHQYWRCGSDDVAEALLLADLPWCIGYIANGHGLSPQSILREINPRMRAGWPTDEELERHLGDWIARDEIGVLRIGRFSEDEEDGRPLFIEGDDESYRTQEEVKGWSFWPCDEHGNKTRRGA